MRRFSIAAMLALVGFAALAFAALRAATNLWSGAIHTFTVFALGVGLVGALIRGRRSGGWIGFAAVGWTTYLTALALIVFEASVPPHLPVKTPLPLAHRIGEVLFPVLNAEPQSLDAIPGFSAQPMSEEKRAVITAWQMDVANVPVRKAAINSILDNVACIVLALLGALVGTFLERRAPRPGPQPIGPN